MPDLQTPSVASSFAGGFEFITVQKIVVMGGASGKNSMLMMQVQNTSSAPDLLYAARLDPPCCRAVQTHIVSPSSGMVPVEGIPIYPNSTQKLPDDAPNYHVMLVGLTRDLKSGDKFTVELDFKLMGILRLEGVSVE